MNETTYTNKIRKLLEAQGAWCLKYRPGSGTKVGVPDLYVADTHGDLWVEFKVKRNKVSGVQASVARQIMERDTLAVVLRGPEGSIESFDGKQFGTLDLERNIAAQLRGFARRVQEYTLADTFTPIS